ncbi:MAG: alpha-glucan family phosphorylase [Candidatus Moranbacteria bacterium]|nr:alpha-glucan family phosphorylase [Candidatus Moranbacteria bacterium]
MIKTFSAENPVAYFSAEFAIHNGLPIYAGGLGVLAGDILKSAADLGIHMAGVGLLYKGEEARQKITLEGNQEENNFDYIPENEGLELIRDATGQPLFVKVHLTQVDVWLQIWRYKIGETVNLYLLDPDNPYNHSHERRLAYALYAGTQEEIIKQQLVLGIGGVKALKVLKIEPTLYHVNEGRPSFLHWQLIRSVMDDKGVSYRTAKKNALEQTVYTNHTIVAAGNQTYDLDLMKAYTKYYAEKMGISVSDLLKDGLDKQGRFDVTLFALNTSGHASSVSQSHFKVCKKNWPKYNWVNITNAVHFPTWHDSRLSADLGDEELWQTHLDAKRKTQELIAARTGFNYDSNKLVITWARRFASYKQPDLLFRDLSRLQDIALSTNRPVQILVAGKAHVFDTESKSMIREIIGHMSRELRGNALFIPDYNMEMGAALTRGSDVWLNTPRKGEEASGTSGMKAISNGVLQVTSDDGWAEEVDWTDENTGWVIDHKEMEYNLFDLIENKVIPTFYHRNEKDLPTKWLKMMRRSIELSPQYNAERMMEEYCTKLYP